MQTHVRGARTAFVVLAVFAWLLPAQAAGAGHAGAGVASGSLTFTNAGGLPPVGAPCVPTTFNVSSTLSGAVVVSTVIVGYAGLITLSGSGASLCENATLGSGSLSLAATGVGLNPANRISCPSLRGSFVRLLAEATVVIAGSCTVNGIATANITFVAEVTFAPGTVGTAGITTPITNALFQGAFAVTS